jgi:mannose/fructose/N-acetylgalactosamine-specific phosphotransferase system component IID
MLPIFKKCYKKHHTRARKHQNKTHHSEFSNKSPKIIRKVSKSPRFLWFFDENRKAEKNELARIGDRVERTAFGV